MRSAIKYLNKAALLSISPNDYDRRNFLLGAIGIRADGIEIFSRNGNNHERTRTIHAEYRLMRKGTPGTVVYVARITRDLQWANAKPCHSCMQSMIRKGVAKIYYTIAPNEYGTITL